MQEEVIYRCINPACARPMPRPVNFCPWCGTAQGQAAARAQEQERQREPDRARREEANATAAATAATAGAAAAAAMSGWSDVPESPAMTAAPPPSPPQERTEAARPDLGKGGAQAPPSATDFGRSAGRAAAAGATAATGAAGAAGAAPPHQEVPRPPIPPRPPQRRPVQLRWWILALAILWGVWLLAKPSTKKIERQIDRAVALAKDCKGSEAQAELIALRGSRATPEQLESLQKTLNDQSAICTTRRLRNKAWNETSAAADTALDAGSSERARTRLQGFIRRWGEDDRTRELKARIDEAAARERHPLAVPRDGEG